MSSFHGRASSFPSRRADGAASQKGTSTLLSCLQRLTLPPGTKPRRLRTERSRATGALAPPGLAEGLSPLTHGGLAPRALSSVQRHLLPPAPSAPTPHWHPVAAPCVQNAGPSPSGENLVSSKCKHRASCTAAKERRLLPHRCRRSCRTPPVHARLGGLQPLLTLLSPQLGRDLLKTSLFPLSHSCREQLPARKRQLSGYLLIE